MKQSAPKAKSGIGVALCDCGGTLADRLDFKRLCDALASREDVAAVRRCSGFCRAAESARIVRDLAAKGCRRIVVGACRRELYEENLADALAQARLKPGLTVEAVIREQCAWAHPDRDQATGKALDLLAAALRRAALAEPVISSGRKVLANVAVLGGGLAGLQAALSLAGLGHAVTLVTRNNEFGGCAARFPDFFGYLDDDPAAASALLKKDLASLRAKIQADKRIRWIPRASLRSVEGEAGRLTVRLQTGAKDQTLKAGPPAIRHPTEIALRAGALVLAVGALEEFPLPEGKGQGRILGLSDLADSLKDNRSLPRSVAIVLDLHGEQGRAVHALALSAAERLAASRRRRVVLYCRHVRVAAWGMEALYRRVREAGVLIFRYEKAPALAEQDKGVMIGAVDPQTGARVEEIFETVVMADVRPGKGRQSLPLPRTLRRGPEGGLQADNIWLASAKSNQPGIYVVGGARGNSELREAQNDAAAVAAEIHQYLGAGRLAVAADAPVVDAEKCVLCLTCMRSCPHGAISVDNRKEAAAMSAVACQRCGLCATLCPARAIAFPRFTDDQLAAELSAGPKTTVFACENSAWPAANAAGIGRRAYDADVRLIRVPCAGRVDDRQVLGALEQGARRVLILGCHREACRYLVGADHAAKRVERLKAILAKAGLDPARVGVGHLTEFESGRFLELVKS